ncbi:L-seryl-tRNA(Sec) selenium transferase [Salirhabdus salicampi]|uniref:L-seryl-tRNA(Sec) selenium transferase n=1 Tax=Salirhabdus salicampi TaxID=476102 RepID=UPI0020C53734|nr:L-seryl-tRNA(Sec) selenium transferase [Salirhabdus salicampi]MCP8616415.1 L-seryl-tRNA(Sec) selenium transferase [Salirhabdus salicampi]
MEKQELLRSIPPVHELQNMEELLEIEQKYRIPKERMTLWLQTATSQLRQKILAEKDVPDVSAFPQYIYNRVKRQAKRLFEPQLKRVINGTGTVLHTNLGRARLSKEAIEHVQRIAGHYSNLEYDLAEGKRGSRHSHIEHIIQEVTGAEAAMVVNNNAAAAYLILRSLSKDKEVIVSRGELVEIGGSFRVSSIMEESDANLVEVGTTNKTHLRDYEQAITEETNMIMKVHTSNFKIVGFTASVERDDLIKACNQHNLIFYEDLGSGALLDFKQHSIGDEPHVSDIIKQGADIVSFSGDKLLGGPQAGIIAGKKKYIDHLKKHQLARVLRVDKMTLAALEITLKEYIKSRNPEKHNVPTANDILKSSSQLQEEVNEFMERCGELNNIKATPQRSVSYIGGGTMPDEQLDTFGVFLTSETISSKQLERKLRSNETPVIGRFLDETLYLDFRTINDEERELLIEVLTIIDQTL